MERLKAFSYKKVFALAAGVVLFTAVIIYGPLGGKQLNAPDNAATKGELMKRENIDEKYKWDLKDIFETEAQWHEAFAWVEKNVGNFKEFEGKIGASGKNLLELLRFNDEFSNKFDKVYLYSSLAKDLDLKNQEYQEMYQRVLGLAAKISSAVSYIKPEILAISNSKLKKFISKEKGLQLYSHYLDNLMRMQPHTLNKEQEQLLSYSAPVGEVYMGTYRLWANADIQFPKVKDSEGNEIQLSHARYYSSLTDLDRDYRERAYKAFYIPFINMSNTLTSLYTGSIKYKIFQAKARNYNNTLEAALDQNNIPVKVYRNLVSTVNENLEPLHRWAEIKRQRLGAEKLHPYDTYVSLFGESKKEYTYDEAVDIILNALKPLGDQYIKDMKFAFENRWIDVYETAGKRSGAYSSGTVKGVHPYVLLNWAGQLNDVFVLAHEMGHNMHSYLTQNTQPHVYADYPIFLAEIASITNEILLMNYLIDNANTKEEKLVLIETYLNNIKGTFYRQTRFAEFEMLAQSKMEAGEVLTTDKMAELFGELYQKYWGPAMLTDMEEKYSWARIHHFFYNFYVYQYATGMAAAEAIAAQITEEGQPAVDRYMKFLKSGNSQYAIETLKDAGVDMTKPQPVLAVIKKAGALLDQMESLMKNKIR